MNLHIMPDSIYSMKFIEYIGKHFPLSEHYFIIITNLKELKYIQTNDMSQIFVLHLDNLFSKINCLNNKKLKDLINKCPRVFIHFLMTPSAFILLRYTKHTHTLIWVPWGGDIYDSIPGSELLENETKDCTTMTQDSEGIVNVIKVRLIRWPIKRVAISRLDYIALDIKVEYDLIKENYCTSAVCKEFHYPSPIDFQALEATIINHDANFVELTEVFKFSKLIQVGNSGDPSNNHISILKLLQEVQPEDFGIVCPLSYGDTNYINSVIKIGRELFGERFIPITDFLHPKVYFALLNKVDVAIMNHYRQQGNGNIIPLIYLGKKVYLRERTTTFNAFQSIGIKLERTESLFMGGAEDIFAPYEINEKENNREVIRNMHSEEEDIRKMKELFII